MSREKWRMDRNIFSVVAILLILFGAFPDAWSQTLHTKDLLKQLCQLIQEKEIYTQQKENSIREIQKILNVPNISSEQHYSINKRLFDEFKTYIPDSAVYYVKENIAIAQQVKNTLWQNDSKFDLTSLYIISGLYLDAFEVLQSVKKDDLSKDLLIKYYDCYQLLYNNYAFNNPNSDEYIVKSNHYRDSVLGMLDKNSSHYQIAYADILAEHYQLEEAKNILLTRFEQLETDNHEKAVVAYVLGTIYKKEKNVTKQTEYFAISAACDIKNAIKENASMLELATTLFELGDVESAYLFIKSSMEDAMFCNAQLRSDETMQIFPIIEAAYRDEIQNQYTKLRFSLAAVLFLSVFLIAAIIYVYRQMKRIAKIRKEIVFQNIDLENLNNNLREVVDKLNATNVKLSEVNSELLESNEIKEAYIGQFFNLCSIYINKLEKYQYMLNKKAKDRNIDELFKVLRSTEMIDNELKELYRLFDEIFLHLYPNFIHEFNNLLLEEERFVLKPNEMNPELRIFALIRLGITDSSKIASFLHYSTNTIYNYRTRVRNKAIVPREQFENRVMRISKMNHFSDI